ncbi:hypothetical protein [Azospirillum doebereinerae]
MAVQTFNPTDLPQSAANWAVAQRIVGPFAPHAQVTPNLTLALDPGHLLNGTTLTEVNAQNVGPFAPPASGFRIDRVVIDRATGVASVVAGTANSLTPPPIPAGKLPVARVMLQVTTDAVGNDLIVDERALSDLTPPVAETVICRANLGGVNQSIPVNAQFTVNFSTTDINIGNGFDTTTHQFRPSTPGYYHVHASVDFRNFNNGAMVNIYLYKNTANQTLTTLGANASVTITNGMEASDIIYLNGITDYVEVRGWLTLGSSPYIAGGAHVTHFEAFKIG